jgi:cell division protein FtsZ
MGYDPTLDKKIGITLIATGFEHKDPFSKPVPVQKAAPVEEKIVMTLDVAGAEPKMPVAAKPANPQPQIDPFEPSLQDSDELLDMPIYKSALEVEAPVYMVEPIVSAALDATEEHEVFHFELSLDLPETVEVKAPEMEILPEPVAKTELEELVNFTVSDQPAVVNTNRFAGLSKPNNIYAETPVTTPAPVQVAQVVTPVVAAPVQEQAPAKAVTVIQPTPQVQMEEEEPMQLVMREEVAPAPQVAPVQASIPQEDAYLDESEEQKRRAAERIQKLRNLSFNMNTTDPNNEFDSVPAYIRRNMELFGNTLTSVENFYSKVTVGKDANNQTQLSTINTFLDGKKPD